MVDDELPPNDNAEPVIPPGPRRSTYTPPPSSATYDPTATDDDALAGALSQEFQRWVPPTGSITVVEAKPAPVAEPVAAPPAPSVSVPAPAPMPVSAPAPLPMSVPAPMASPVPMTSPIPLASPTEPVRSAYPAPAREPTPIATEPTPPAMPFPGEVPPPPQRISLTDTELIAVADLDSPEHDTAALLDLVERELELRQVEARRLEEWEQQVRATATPDADELVSRVRQQFTGVIPIIPPSPSPSPSSPPPVPPLPPPAPLAAPVGPSLDLALADAPPPYGIVPSAVAPPPSATAPPFSPVEPTDEPGASWSLDAVAPEVVPLVEPPLPGPTVAPGPATPVEGAALLFDALLREPDRVPDSAEPGEPASTDDALPAAALAATAATMPSPHAVSSAVPAGNELVVTAPRAGRVEVSALEPTPAAQRAGRSIRLFWLWFAVNASAVSLALGGVIVGVGVSLRQAILAAFVGVAMSFLPLGLGTLAGKWSGQPTMVVSRATFGTAGNLIPALLALVTRLAWSASLLWMLGTGVAEVLVGSGLVEGLGRLELTIAAAAIGLVIAAVVAGFGFGMIAIVSAIVSAISAVLVVGLIVLTLPWVDLAVALSLPDGDWMLLVSGAVLVFSVVGLAWANSSGDLARYQAKGTYGSSAVLWASFGATIPAFLLIGWGAILAASNPIIGEGLQSNPIDLVSRLLPLWYPVPLIAAVVLGLLSAAALALYSGGFALLAIGVRAPRAAAVTVIVVLTGVILALLIVVVPDVASLFRDVVTTLAVPVAAWAGIFGAETMIRTRRVHSPSLLRSGGVYPAVRWVNLVMLLVITAVGWGLSTAAVMGLQWQGYLFTLLGIDTAGALAASDPGVLVALLLGLLTPLVAGIPALRRLQAAERSAAEADAAPLQDLDQHKVPDQHENLDQHEVAPA